MPRSVRSWDLVVVLIGYVGVSRTGGRHTRGNNARGDWHPDGRPVASSQTGDGNPMGGFVESLSRRVWAVLK